MATQKVTELSAHDQIRQVATRYSRGVDRLDGDLMKSAYWPDGTDDHGVFVGNAMEFCDVVIRSHERFIATMHCIMTTQSKSTKMPARATARSTT